MEFDLYYLADIVKNSKSLKHLKHHQNLQKLEEQKHLERLQVREDILETFIHNQNRRINAGHRGQAIECKYF